MTLLQSKEILKPGTQAPIFILKGTDGEDHSLYKGFKGAKAFLIVFMCNHCPYVKPKIETMKKLQADYKNKGLVVIGINTNNNPDYPDDSFENMQKVAKEHSFNFLYLFDESQEVSRRYGAVCTPDPFLFNEKFELEYHGRFDNALDPGQKPTTRDMKDAIEAVLKGDKPKQSFLPSQGCSIKWV